MTHVSSPPVILTLVPSGVFLAVGGKYRLYLCINTRCVTSDTPRPHVTVWTRCWWCFLVNDGSPGNRQQSQRKLEVFVPTDTIKRVDCTLENLGCKAFCQVAFCQKAHRARRSFLSESCFHPGDWGLCPEAGSFFSLLNNWLGLGTTYTDQPQH